MPFSVHDNSSLYSIFCNFYFPSFRALAGSLPTALSICRATARRSTNPVSTCLPALLSFENQFFGISKSIVTRGDHPIPCFQSFDNLILTRILPAYRNGYFHRSVTGFVQFVDPLSSRILEEIAFRNNDGTKFCLKHPFIRCYIFNSSVKIFRLLELLLFLKSTVLYHSISLCVVASPISCG